VRIVSVLFKLYNSIEVDKMLGKIRGLVISHHEPKVMKKPFSVSAFNNSILCPFVGFPSPLYMEIFSHLSPEDIGRIARVCKVWYFVFQENDAIWKTFCMKKWPKIPEQILKGGRAFWRQVFSANSGYSWNPTEKSSALVVSNNDNSVKRPDSEGNSPICITRQKYKGGLFLVHIDSPQSWINNRMSVGIVSYESFKRFLDPNLEGSKRVVGKLPNSYGYVCDDSRTCTLYYEGLELPAQLYTYGDVVGFAFNIRTNKITFLLNGEIVGEHIISGNFADYYCAVSLANDNQVSILVN